MKTLNLGIVGATGVVGETFLKLLDERKTPINDLRLFASESSKGKIKSFRGKDITLQVLEEGCFDGLDVVFFSSGDDISKDWAPKAAKAGAFAIDNSAAYRMDKDTALVIPEINFDHIKDPSKAQVIANPNCSTIQLVMALQALKEFGPTDVRVSSYQSVSGAGREAIDDLKTQSQEKLTDKNISSGAVFKTPIAFDCHPMIGSLDDDGFCSEENKIVRETKKILSMPELKVSAFTVRIPTLNSHAEAVWVTLKKDVSMDDIMKAFEKTPGVKYLKNPQEFYTLSQANNQDDTLVSRIRKARDQENTWMFWVVADNIRRGAASNGLFIAEKLFS